MAFADVNKIYSELLPARERFDTERIAESGFLTQFREPSLLLYQSPHAPATE